MGSSAAGLCIHCTATEAEKCKWRGGNWPQPQRERGRSRSFTVTSMNNEEGGRKIEQRKQVGSIRASEIKTERLGS